MQSTSFLFSTKQSNRKETRSSHLYYCLEGVLQICKNPCKNRNEHVKLDLVSPKGTSCWFVSLYPHLYLALKHHSVPMKAWLWRLQSLNSTSEQERSKSSCIPKGPGQQGGNTLGHKVPGAECALQKRSAGIANHKIMFKKENREQNHETYLTYKPCKSMSKQSAIKKDSKY